MFDKKAPLIILLLIICPPIFIAIDKLPILLWDESRLAFNAWEMYKNGFSVVTTYDFSPETWNTKPPMLIWLEALSFKIFGVNEFSFRLPSALAAIGTCLMMFWFSKKQLGKPWLGVLAALILVTSLGFTNYHHSARSGDYDSLLTFFVTTYMLLFFTFIEEGKAKYIFLSMLALSFAVLTKGIAGLIMAPGMLVYTIYRNKILFTLKKPAFYAGIATFLVLTVGYYLLREHYQPGYFGHVNANELGGRYAEVGENTNESILDPYYYYHWLVNSNFSHWYWILPLSLVFGVYARHIKTKNATFFLAVSATLFLMFISFATGRNNWYDMPAYPLLSILAAMGVYTTCQLLAGWQGWKNKFIINVLPVVLLVYLTVRPYAISLDRAVNPDPGEWIEGNVNMTHFLKDVRMGRKEQLKNFKIIKGTEYEVNVNWYVNVINDQPGYNIEIIEVDGTKLVPGLVAGDTAVVYFSGIKDFLEYYYFAEQLAVIDNVAIYKINGVEHEL